jgi:hypothetical protein
MLYKALLNPADQIFTAAEFVKTDRLHRALQLRERIRLALGLARSISHAPATHLARFSPRLCMPTCEVVLYELHLYRAKHGRAMHNGRPEQRKFDASQGNSAAQLATTMVLG